MKKIFLLLFFIFFNTSYASNDVINGLKDIPSNFDPECYEYSSKVDNSNFEKGITYYLNVNKSDILVTQNNKILPVKLSYQEDGVYADYSFEGDNYGDFDYRYLQDNNNKTFLEYTLGDNELSDNEIIIEFNEEVKEYTSFFNFSYESDYYLPELYISNNGSNYNKVTRENISDFMFSYLKIKFIGKPGYNNTGDFAEKIRINELSFMKNMSGFLFMSLFDEDINIYSSYNCKDNFRVTPNPFYSFSTDSETKTVYVVLTKNNDYNVYVGKDVDNDGVIDSEDNCKDFYNPMQKDSNADNKGDLCSDDDNDSIIGHKDNCINVSNRDQKDINRNGVGDVCEFDKDKDTIFDSLDNCINTSNIGQDDDDNDGIGNLCDNCKMYNPRQLDKDNSGVGDVCEQNDKYVLENDDDKDGVVNNSDNCIDIANENQLDTDKDGVGDACDNCINIQNSKQIDENENLIGDMCEDSDSDGIEGLVDNCLNVANPDQKDSDNNGIGDVCEDTDKDKIIFINDNCPYDYNPDQRDTDNDKIGDKCDDSDDRYIESNKNIFIGFMVFIALLFFVGISLMLKKLGNTSINEEEKNKK